MIDQPDIVEILAPPRLPERHEFDVEEVPPHAAVVEDQVFELALEIVDHLAHTVGLDPLDDDRAVALSESIARGLVDPEPAVEMVAPVLLTRFDIEERIKLSGQLSIERMSEIFIREKTLSDSRDHLEVTLADCATHALVLSGYYLINKKRLLLSLDPPPGLRWVGWIDTENAL